MQVTLRRVTRDNFQELLDLRITNAQQEMVASVERSLAQAAVEPALHPFAVYDSVNLGVPVPTSKPVGFLVLQVHAGVGFILRLLIDAPEQGVGYGRAALQRAIEYLSRIPEVETIATSYRPHNQAMAHLTASMGFREWQPPPWGSSTVDEVYVVLD
jgi:diamine N-acetyltransferase